MVIVTGTVKFYCRVLVVFSFLLVAAYFSIHFLTNNDDGIAVQQFRFKTKDGVQYTITIDKYINNEIDGFNIRMFTLDTSSAPLSSINSVHFSYGGLYYDCDTSIEAAFCQYTIKAKDGVDYLNAYPVHEIY